MRNEAPDAPHGSTAGDTEIVSSMTARFGGALLLLALVAGTLFCTVLYPPAALGSVVASIALATCLGCVASRGSRPDARCTGGRRDDVEPVPRPGPVSRRNREELVRTCRRFEQALAAAGVGVWDWDVRAGRLNWDAPMHELHGTRPGDFGGSLDAWLSTLHPDDVAHARQEACEALSRGDDYESEFRVVRPDGTIRHLVARGALVRDEDGRPSRMIGVAVDITGRKEAELALQTAKEYAENLIDTANAMVVVLDNRGCVRDLNPAAERITGYTRAELVGRSWFEVLVPKGRYPQVWEVFDRLMAGGLVRNFENPILTKAGAERHIVWQNAVVREQGKSVGTVSFGMDITDRKRTEEALARERSLLNELITTIPDNIYFKDRDCRFTKVNHAMARWLGLGNPDDAVGKSDRDFFGPEHTQQAYADEQRVMATGQPLVGLEEKETWPNGRTTWVSTSKVPLRDESGQIVGLVGVSRDITERRHPRGAARLQARRWRRSGGWPAASPTISTTSWGHHRATASWC